MTYPEPIINVRCHNCQKDSNEEYVEIHDISENMLGEDVVVFTCPSCGYKGKSSRFRSGWR